MQLIYVYKHHFKSKLYKQLTDFKNIYNNNKIIKKLYARHDDYLTDLLSTTSSIYARSNRFIRTFHHCSVSVKLHLCCVYIVVQFIVI